jgi:hypothetical protein
VTDALLDHLPPQGQKVATAEQVEDLRLWTEEQFTGQRRWTDEQFGGQRSWAEGRFDGLRSDVTHLRGEMQHLVELQTERVTSRWRRDLLLLAIPQFLVLLGIVVSLNV